MDDAEGLDVNDGVAVSDIIDLAVADTVPVPVLHEEAVFVTVCVNDILAVTETVAEIV